MTCARCGYPRSDPRMPACLNCGASFAGSDRPAAPPPSAGPGPQFAPAGQAQWPPSADPYAPGYVDPYAYQQPQPQPPQPQPSAPGPLAAPAGSPGRTLGLVGGGLVLLVVAFVIGYLAITRLLF